MNIKNVNVLTFVCLSLLSGFLVAGEKGGGNEGLITIQEDVFHRFQIINGEIEKINNSLKIIAENVDFACDRVSDYKDQDAKSDGICRYIQIVTRSKRAQEAIVEHSQGPRKKLRKISSEIDVLLKTIEDAKKKNISGQWFEGVPTNVKPPW